MSKEKIVKKQAREAMKGNTLPIIAGMALSALIFVMLQNIMYVVMIAFDAINIETEKMNAGSDIPYYVTLASVVVAGVLLSPFFNGTYKTAANAVINNNCEVTDLFYFFKGFRRYMKTLIVNMTMVLIYGTFTSVFEGLMKNVFGKANPGAVIASVLSGLFAFLIYALFLHYPLCLYAVDDSRSALRYMFGYIGFSFKHFWAFIRLVFSMIGWLLLCFFIAPVFYVGPYALCAAINSARWLKEADDEKAARKYVPQQLFLQDTQNNNMGDNIVW